jgi:hypothetical protein
LQTIVIASAGLLLARPWSRTAARPPVQGCWPTWATDPSQPSSLSIMINQT